MTHKVSDDEMIDELTGYHLNEVAHMNPPEDEPCELVCKSNSGMQ